MPRTMSHLKLLSLVLRLQLSPRVFDLALQLRLDESTGRQPEAKCVAAKIAHEVLAQHQPGGVSLYQLCCCTAGTAQLLVFDGHTEFC